MNLLVVTQKIDLNDDNLAFFHGWISELAKNADLVVIANYTGRHNLPENVKIFSLGKERGASRILKFLRLQRLLFVFLPKVDGVFFHMCPEYVIAAGVLPKIFGKKTLFWYVHKHINFRLWLAEKLVDKIFTASKESFRLPSKKVEIVGHGIDLNKFKVQSSKFKVIDQKSKLKIITAGRIAPIKNLDLLIEAAENLKKQNVDFKIEIAGAPILESDEAHLLELKEMVARKNLESRVEFIGIVPYYKIMKFYASADLMVNLSDTGSIDKAVLEAMVSGCRVLTSNDAFQKALASEYLTGKDPLEISRKIVLLSKQESSRQLSEYVFKHHNLENLIKLIIDFFKNGK